MLILVLLLITCVFCLFCVYSRVLSWVEKMGSYRTEYRLFICGPEGGRMKPCDVALEFQRVTSVETAVIANGCCHTS